jgi:hypothetical protein
MYRYVAPESPMEIDFPLDVKNSIVTGICSESGNLDPKCFDSALNFVKSTVENRFFGDFLQSEFNAKHEVYFIAVILVKGMQSPILNPSIMVDWQAVTG